MQQKKAAKTICDYARKTRSSSGFCVIAGSGGRWQAVAERHPKWIVEKTIFSLLSAYKTAADCVQMSGLQ